MTAIDIQWILKQSLLLLVYLNKEGQFISNMYVKSLSF